MGLSKENVARYGRQLILPEFGVAGQQKLNRASVTMIGAGGLGCSAAVYLAAAGVGKIRLVDSDSVQMNNLHRQILHTTEAVGSNKTHSAAERLKALNPTIHLECLAVDFTVSNASELIADSDLVLDGSDNFPTRYLVNDACVLNQIPFIYGGAIKFQGQLLAVRPTQSACFRCVFQEPPGEMPSCQEAGVLGATVGVIGALMAMEGIKLLAGIGMPLTDRLMVFDGFGGGAREVPVRRATDCEVCGDKPSITNLNENNYAFCRPACA